jgi:spermidine synthase
VRTKPRKISHFFDGVGVALERLDLVATHGGKFGRINLFNHPELGKVFVLDGEIQHVEAWAPLYHEPLVHLSAAFVNEVKDVLILGGGTLYAAAEVLKYKSVERVVLFDHDPAITQMVVQHYEHARACLKDSRLTLFHNDAYSSLLRFKNQFDLVINDGGDLLSANPKGNGGNSQIFRSMTAALRTHGVCVDVVFRHLFERQRILRTINILRHRLRFAMSMVFLPEYHGVLHLLCVWGKETSFVNQNLAHPKNKEQLSWVKKPALCPCVYYDPRYLNYYLYLPRYLKSPLLPKNTNF